MIRIGSQNISTNIFMAPLSGCTDLAFRLIVREYGAGMCFFEMIDSKSLVYNHKKTLELLTTHKDDVPIAAQLLGSDVSVMCDAASRLLEIVKVSFIDINSACPVPKVVKKNAGAKLLQHPDKLFEIISKMADTLPVPVSVKLRIGYKTVDENKILDLVKACESSGASALFIHGRTAVDSYECPVNYDVISKIKKSVKIPVVASGDILSPVLARKMFDSTGCDGILVARGALGNPWIFNSIKKFLDTGFISMDPDFATRKKVLKKHLSLVDRYKESPMPAKLGHMRKIAMWYLKGARRARRIRQGITNAQSYREILGVVDNS